MDSSDNGEPNIAAIDDAADAAFDTALAAETVKPTETAESTSVAPSAPPSTEIADVMVFFTVVEAKLVAFETQDAPEYQNLLAKYGGDKNVAAKAYWDTNNRAAQLAQEKEALAQQ